MNSKESNQPSPPIIEPDCNATNFALRVALQTMKERCQSMQQRLATVEDDNVELRKNLGSDLPKKSPTKHSIPTEIQLLQETVGDLTRQKCQLSQHITMIASENRQLWSRLSKLTKDNQEMKNSMSASPNTHQNLIRSKTFTQNSPNPALRQKLTNIDDPENSDQLSLEEISLKVLNEFLEGKAEIEKKCTEFMETSKCDSFGFGYLTDESDSPTIMAAGDGKSAMTDIKKELLRQQSDLKVALSSLRKRKIPELCLSCKFAPKKPNTADKMLDTEDISTASNYAANLSRIVSNIDIAQPPISDYLERKRIADTLDKMCPMCEGVYSATTTFEKFQEHVESHFIDETDLDLSSIEKNFDFISHSVGNF